MAERRIDSVERPWEELTGTARQDAYLLATKAGNRSALDVLVREMTPLVWHVARGHGLDQHAAEDVAQTVWLALVRHLDRIAEPRTLARWLITTARREARRISESKPSPEPLTHELAETVPDTETTPEAAALREEQSRQIWRAFGKLTMRCQELLRLTVLAGRADYRVVAEAMRMPQGSIGPTRSRCLTSLRNLLSQDGEFWSGSEEGLPNRLDALLDEADPVPDELVAQTLVAVEVEYAVAHVGGWKRPDVPAASAGLDEATDSSQAWAATSRDPEQYPTGTLNQPFFVYVAGDNYQAAKELATAITEVLERQGIEAAPDGPPVISSWAQRFILRVKGTLTRSEVRQRLQKVEHALEVVAVQKPMSEVNAQHADAVNKLLSAAEECDSFVALVGSMLTVKHTDESGRVNAYAQTLSVAQVRALEHNQHLLTSPAELLAHLETLSCTDDHSPATAAHQVNGIVQPQPRPHPLTEGPLSQPEDQLPDSP